MVLETEAAAVAFTTLESAKCLLLFLLEQRLNCYAYTYPVTIILPNGGEKTTVNNKEELIEKATASLINGRDELDEDQSYAIFPALEYPVEIKFQNGDVEKADSAAAEMELFFGRCDGDAGDIDEIIVN